MYWSRALPTAVLTSCCQRQTSSYTCTSRGTDQTISTYSMNLLTWPQQQQTARRYRTSRPPIGHCTDSRPTDGRVKRCWNETHSKRTNLSTWKQVRTRWQIVIKGPDFHIPPLTGKSEQQRFIVRSAVLIGITSRQRSAISSRPLPERTDFGSAVCSHVAVSRTMALWRNEKNQFIYYDSIIGPNRFIIFMRLLSSCTVACTYMYRAYVQSLWALT